MPGKWRGSKRKVKGRRQEGERKVRGSEAEVRQVAGNWMWGVKKGMRERNVRDRDGERKGMYEGKEVMSACMRESG